MNIDPSIFKAYDIRGVYPTQINEALVYKIGQAYANVIKPHGEILIGHDVRIHSQVLKEKLIEGLLDAGVNVIDAGWMSTDMLYFGVGHYKTAGGIQVTASHNPPEWHGAKMVREGVVPITLETGINQIRDFVISGKELKSNKKGVLRSIKTILDDYCKYILTWIDAGKIKPFRVVYNANFGFAGKIFERIVELGRLPLTLIPLNEKPDGTFPKGRPDPFVPENRGEFIELVKTTGADLGVAWDGDADRVFFCAEGGIFIEPYYLNTILIKQMLTKSPNEKVIYDPRYTWALIEAIKESGGKEIICKVGHSYIKEMMRKENALFATESSGHTYYRDYWYADCGMIPPLQVLEYLSLNNKKLVDIVKPVMSKYFISGEINSEVSDKVGKMKKIAEIYKDGKQSDLDGISVEYNDFRFCVRPSNTENLLRLTLEAKSEKLMQEKKDEVLAIIRS
jgi:phosphomannomutase